MRIIIIEDEPPAVARLVSAVRRCDPSIEIAATLGSVRDATDWLRRNPAPELILADIELSDGSALAIFDAVPTTSPVVFCTAYDEYVTEALARNGIDYLLKPIEPERLERALAKYARLRQHFAGQLAGLARELQRPDEPARHRRRLVVRRGVELRSIAVSDVAYFTTEHKLVLLVTVDGTSYVVDKPLSELADELDPDEFFRANRQVLVRHSAVVSFRPRGKGRLAVLLEPTAEVVVSQENARRFRDWLDR